MNKLVFDIGATNTKFAVMTESGNILYRKVSRTNYSSKEAFFDNIMNLSAEHKIGADAIAISTNGRMTDDGNSYRAYTAPMLSGTNLKKELEDRTGLPAAVLNDGFSAAAGEWKYGAGKGYKNVMALVLGSGLGGGLVLNGQIYQGNHRNATAVFNWLIPSGGKSEISAMATSFTMQLYKLAGAKGIPIDEMSGERFFEFLKSGDKVALMLFDTYCEAVAVVAYNTQMLLDLECIIITGGLSSQNAVIEGINRKLKEIPGKLMQGEVAALLAAASVDMKDYDIRTVRGQLGADANLYGALYNLMSEK